MQHIGPFTVERELGRGGMGVVYQVRGPDGRAYALKRLHPQLPGAGQAHLQRVAREVEALSRVQHPGVVRAVGSGWHGGSMYLVMELVHGESLQDLLRREGALAPRRAADVCARLARTLQALHEQGILHRDLKPANVLVERDVPRLTDFGLVRLEDSREQLTRTGTTLGTLGFCAPELLSVGSGQRVGPAVDVYGLGATLYALLTGRAPFEGASAYEVAVQTVEREPERPSDSRDEASRSPALRALDAVCLRCLAKDPAQRYPSAEALAEELEAIARGEAPAGEGPRRSSARLIAALCGALVLGAGGLGVAALARRGDEAVEAGDPRQAAGGGGAAADAAPADSPPDEADAFPAWLAPLGPLAGPLWEARQDIEARALAEGGVSVSSRSPELLVYAAIPRQGPGRLVCSLVVELPPGSQATAGLIYGLPEEGGFYCVATDPEGQRRVLRGSAAGGLENMMTLGEGAGPCELGFEETADGQLSLQLGGAGIGLGGAVSSQATVGLFIVGAGEVRLADLRYELTSE